MRVTLQDIKYQIEIINKIKGTPNKPYIDRKPQAWCYHLSQAYGGVALHQMSGREGCTGVSDIFGGHMPKKELYNRLAGFIALQRD